jgi:hypothetical protein
MLRYSYGKGVGSKIAWASSKEGDRVGVGPGAEQVVEGNDSHGGPWPPCESLPAPTLSPSFLLAQAIFEPNPFPYEYLNISPT